MTHAELLRSHADLATKEGGIYYSGEYLSGIATAAESLEAENAKLRELVRAAWRCIHTRTSCYDCRLIAGGCTLQTAMRELEIEVDA